MRITRDQALRINRWCANESLNLSSHDRKRILTELKLTPADIDKIKRWENSRCAIGK